METSKRAPAFQLYPQDFISSLDVQMMSAAEVGAYCLLLFNSWTQPKQGYLPNDEAQLRHISRLSPEEWKQSKKKLLAKFAATPDKKHRYNARLLSEAEKHSAFRDRQAENGKRGGRPRREEVPQKPLDSAGETQNNPSLSQPLEVANPTESSSTSSSTSTSFSSSEESSSLRSEPAASAAALGPEKKTEEAEASQRPTEHLTIASRTGGAADVPTRKGRKPPTPLAGPLADLMNPGGVADAVQAMRKPFTQAEADALVGDYGEPAARRIVQEMANYAKLGNNISANLTARKWLDKRAAETLTAHASATPFVRAERGAHPTAAAALGARAVAEQFAALDAAEREQRLCADGGALAAGPYAR